MKPELVVTLLPEEECDEAVCPGVCPKEVEYPQPGTTEAYPGEKLELKAGFAVQRALDVVSQHDLRQLVEPVGVGHLGAHGQLSGAAGSPRGHVSEHDHQGHGQTRPVRPVRAPLARHLVDGNSRKRLGELVLPPQLKK